MMFKVKAKFDKNAKKYFDVYINLDKINYIAKNEVMLDKGLCYLDETSLAELTRYIDFMSLLKKAFMNMNSEETAKLTDMMKRSKEATIRCMNNDNAGVEKSSTNSSFFKKIWRRIVEIF